ncbi:MAG: TrkH family potassium uptake protein [Clostridia bacterium]|nr:TrkH family potassium uptake protein [Clostridia bacterium]
MKIRHKVLNSERIVVLGFTALILLGAVLLWLPISSKNGTSFIDALFTATSSSCVTGLVVKDTASHFNLFGKTVILIMIQIGGMGVITMTTLVAMLIGKHLGISERNTIKNSISANHIGGIVGLTGFIVRTAAVIEALGAVALFFVFLPDYGVVDSIEYGIFHSVSGFCNAGFDIVAGKAPFSSLCGYVDNPLLNITIMFLIIVGGIGFLTWEDIKTNKFSFRKYRLQTKIILTTTLILVIIPALFFYFFEFSKMAVSSRILASFFQSVTLRTAGFNTVSFENISDSGKLMMIFLMLIGGAPGSTAGGMKITTVAVLYASVVSVFKRRDNAEIYKRRLPENVIKNAAAIFILYLFLFFLGAAIISRADNLPVFDCMFETASAIGTVGLTLGITPALSSVSKGVLIALMFLGRVGGLTFVFATVADSKYSENRYPKENVTVG